MPRSRNIGALVLGAPKVPDALELIPDDQGILLIGRASQDSPLRVVIDTVWDLYPDDPPGSVTTLWLLWDDVRIVKYEFTWPFDPAQLFPFTMWVPRQYLTSPGIHRIKYEVVVWTGNPDFSMGITVNIDREAPNHNTRGEWLVFEDEVMRNGVTDAYLEANGGNLPAVVPHWPDMRDRDVVEFFIGASADPSDPGVVRGGSVRVGPEHVAGEAVSILFPREVLNAVGNGYRYAFYFLTDRAGNQGPRSRAQYIELALTGPIELLAPLVPLADVDRLIDLADVRTGVQVHVRLIEQARVGDIIQAYWNGRPLAPVEVGANQVWPLRLPVAWNVISADGFDAAVSCTVYYQIRRGAQRPYLSPNTSFTVDLTVAGPDPVGPDPINPRLPPVVVKGRAGDDILGGEDYQEDARVQVRLFEKPEAGDLLQLYWGSYPQVAAIYRVQSADRAGDWVTFTPVPWRVIEAVGNGSAVPVYYWTTNGINEQRSKDTPVAVRFPTLQDLQPAEFPDATLFGWINCTHEPWNGIKVRVPFDARMRAGDRLELTWQLCRGTNGERPMEGIRQTFIKQLTQQELSAREIDVIVGPFETLVLPLWPLGTRPPETEGAGLVSYTLQLQDGRLGSAPKSYISISLTRPGAQAPCTGAKR